MRLLILISKIHALLRRRLIFSKSLVFIWCLILACSFVEYRVVAMFIDFLTAKKYKDSLRKAAIVTNWQDGLSSVFVFFTHLLEANTGSLSVIISSMSAYVVGLMLFWVSELIYQDSFWIYMVGILLIALGRAGSPALYAFLDYQIKEIVRPRVSIEVNQDHPQVVDISEDEEKNDHVVRVSLWWRTARISGALIATFLPAQQYWAERLKIAVLAMVSSYLFFFSGYIFYAFQEPTATPLTKILKVFKVALRKFDLQYPRDHERYYWNNSKRNHTYKRNNQFQLLPRVPRLWRWLDKAAIIREPQPPNPSPHRQELDENLCNVKDVREVKRFASLIHLCFTLFPYSMVVAAGNTFFVEQTSNLKYNSRTSGLFLLQNVTRDIILFLIWLSKLTKQKWTKVRIGAGLAFAVICCIIAYLVEHRRLSLVKEKGVVDNKDEKISMGIEILTPQYLVQGIMAALAGSGLEELYYNYVPQSLWRFGEPFCECVLGIGKLLTIPFVSFIPHWFKDSMNTSHVDRYYLALGILNFVFIFIYGYYSTKYREDYPEDEQSEDEELMTAEMEEINPENGHQASQEEANGVFNISPLHPPQLSSALSIGAQMIEAEGQGDVGLPWFTQSS